LLFVTNNSPAFTNSTFNFNFGNLTTLQGSVVTQHNNFVIGSVSNQTATWTMARGTNIIAMDGSSGTLLGSSPDSRGVVVASGSSTVWSNSSLLAIGGSGSASQLIVSNGATVLVSGHGVLGLNTGANSNSVLVSDATTRWLIGSDLYVGSNGAFNRLIVSNGGLVQSSFGFIGAFGSGGTNNEALVTGPGSRWRMDNGLGFLFIGDGFNTGNRLVISNGGSMFNDYSFIGYAASNCEALVTGPGSVWTNRAELHVGNLLGGNRLVVSNGGSVVVSDLLSVGTLTPSFNNRVVVDGGTLRVSNNLTNGTLEVRRGTNVLNAGLIEADIVRMTNGPQSVLEFNGGTLSAKSSRIASGTILRLGNGVSPATMVLAGNGIHDFAGNLVVRVASNAVLTGNGTLLGGISILSGGTLSPGASVGKMIFSNAPSLQGATVMEIGKNGSVLTNDQIQVPALLTYGGTLTVSNLGPTALVAGDRFPLFSAGSYTGAFSAITLPLPPNGLDWTNKLLVDGSIELVEGPKFTSVGLSGTNLIVMGTGGRSNASYAVLTATNVAQPLSDWLILVTNLFGPSGEFSSTNAILPGELQRYFRIRTP
jgi:T5SS/PEP-CTERM-associated repeat protein